MKLKLFKTVLKSAVRVCEKAKDDQLREMLDYAKEGLSKFENQCDHCKQPLLIQKKLEEFLEEPIEKRFEESYEVFETIKELSTE